MATCSMKQKEMKSNPKQPSGEKSLQPKKAINEKRIWDPQIICSLAVLD